MSRTGSEDHFDKFEWIQWRQLKYRVYPIWRSHNGPGHAYRARGDAKISPCMALDQTSFGGNDQAVARFSSPRSRNVTGA